MLLAEVAARNRFDESSVGEFDRRGLVGVINGGHDVTSAGLILEQNCFGLAVAKRSLPSRKRCSACGAFPVSPAGWC